MTELQFEQIPMEGLGEFFAWIHQDHLPASPKQMEAWFRGQVEHPALGWIARRLSLGSHALLGAYALRYPGKIGVLSGLRVATGVTPDEAGEWLKIILQQTAELGCDLIQIILDEPRYGLRYYLQAAGMKHAATLLQMGIDLSLGESLLLREEGVWNTQENEASRMGDKTGEQRDPSLSIEWEPYQATETARWLQMLERSYVESSDCPELNGLRKIDDTWQGYASAANHQLQEWWLLRIDGLDAGCLLLTEQGAGQWELTYMGIAPEFRGRGLGSTMLEYAKTRIHAVQGTFLHLAVDYRNHFAIEVYRRAGLHALQEMDAWIWKASFPTDE